jgi:hypothetical protein
MKLNIELHYDPAVLLGIYLKEMKLPSHKDICTPIFIIALFSLANIWKQLVNTIGQMGKKSLYIYIYIYIYIYQHLKRRFCHFPQHGWTWGSVCKLNTDTGKKKTYRT